MIEETQTIDEIMDAAMGQDSDSVEETPEQGSQETTPEPETATPPQETKEVEIESQDSYTRIDPKTLPPELQAMHKNLLKDYTKKTQTLSKQRRELEEYVRSLQTSQNQNYGQQEQAAYEQPQQAQQPNSSMTLEEYESYLLGKVEEKLSLQQQQRLEEQETSYFEKAVGDFETLDERLNPESPAYDYYMRASVGLELDKALEDYKEANGSIIGFDVEEVAKDLVNQFDNYLGERAKTLAQQKTQEAFKSAKKNAAFSTTGSSVSSTPAGSMSIDEALDNAFSSNL